MRCRECGLELDERDLLRNGAYQCPECGTIHHTATSRKASPSPYRRGKRRKQSSPAVEILTRRVWLLPLWSYIAIALAVVIAVILLLTLGGKSSTPQPGGDMPAAVDTPISDATSAPVDSAEDETGDGANAGATANPVDTMDAGNTLPAEPALPTSNGHTGITGDDFSVSFDWAMSMLESTSTLKLVSNETNANGEEVRSYDFEDWFHVVMAIDPSNSAIRSAVATVSESESKADSTNMIRGFITTLYCFDTSLNATKAQSEVNGMLTDNVRTYGTSSFVAKIDSSDPSGYKMEIAGKL